MTERLRTIRTIAIVLPVAFLMLGTGLAIAQEDRLKDPEQNSSGAYGLLSQVHLVYAEQFSTKEDAATSDLEYDTFHFYFSPGATGQDFYYAPLLLPAGARITSWQCIVNDVSSTNNITVQLQRYSHNVLTKANDGDNLSTVASTGSSGFQVISATPSPIDVTYIDNNLNLHYTWYLRAGIPADVTIRNCEITWQRKISPGTVQSFTDVPAGSGGYDAVEALKAAGITAGSSCPPTAQPSFCPDAVVTRGQMALFLARALGLHWPQ